MAQNGYVCVDPANDVTVILGRRDTGSTIECKVDVWLGTGKDEHETEAFELGSSGLEIRIKIKRHPNTSTPRPAFQFLLVEPKDDMIQVKIGRRGDDAKQAILTNCNKSFIQYGEYGSRNSDGTMLLYEFIIILDKTLPMFKKYFSLDTDPDVTLEMGEDVILTRWSLISAHSDVFRMMFENDSLERQTGVIQIKDFDFTIVQEMIRFMMHDTCCLWQTRGEDLNRIAKKYMISGMLQLSAKKKKLLDILS